MICFAGVLNIYKATIMIIPNQSLVNFHPLDQCRRIIQFWGIAHSEVLEAIRSILSWFLFSMVGIWHI